MDQMRLSVMQMHHADVTAELSACLEAGLYVTAMIDPLTDDTLVQTMFNDLSHLPYTMLFLQTPFEHVLEITPYLVEIESVDDAFCQSLLDFPDGWGFFAVSSLPLNETIKHWRSLLQIHSDNTITHFRFYDSQILCSLWPVLGEVDAADLLGPHCRLYLPPLPPKQKGDDNEAENWSYLSHPSSADPKTIGEHYVLRESPWWTLTPAHWAAFEDIRPKIMANNIKEFLFEFYPSQAGARHARENLGDFCLFHFQRADAFGIRDEKALKYFVACCMLYGERFPEGFTITMPSAPDQSEALADELRSLCEKAVNNE